MIFLTAFEWPLTWNYSWNCNKNSHSFFSWQPNSLNLHSSFMDYSSILLWILCFLMTTCKPKVRIYLWTRTTLKFPFTSYFRMALLGAPPRSKTISPVIKCFRHEQTQMSLPTLILCWILHSVFQNQIHAYGIELATKYMQYTRWPSVRPYDLVLIAGTKYMN